MPLQIERGGEKVFLRKIVLLTLLSSSLYAIVSLSHCVYSGGFLGLLIISIYADWDDAGNVAGASQLAITAGRWDVQSVFRIKPHTNVMNIYSEADNCKALYLFTDFNYEAAIAYLSKHDMSFKLLKIFTSSTGEKNISCKWTVR